MAIARSMNSMMNARTALRAMIVGMCLVLVGMTAYQADYGENEHEKTSSTVVETERSTAAEEPSDSTPEDVSPLPAATGIKSVAAATPHRRAFDPNVTEIPEEDPIADGALYDAPMKGFTTKLSWRGKCWYEVENFCVIRGQLTFFHDAAENAQGTSGALRMCNEFSQHSELIKLHYVSRPNNGTGILPAPLLTKTPGWVLQFWCQDLFHMTLGLMPAFHTARHVRELFLSYQRRHAESDSALVGPNGVALFHANDSATSFHPDIYMRIAKGKRKRSAYCRIKFGHPQSYDVVRNERWGDHQFPFPGNPYWPFYQVISPEPHRMHPLYAGSTKKSACYRIGAIDKLYIKETMGKQAHEYTAALLMVLNVSRDDRMKRKCREYRATIIDRRGRTRRLTNIPELVSVAESLGFKAQSVALEKIPIREQIALLTRTDVLVGVHGNGLTWLQFLSPGSVVVELVGIWYQPYSKLWGHLHLHSSMKNNMEFKRKGEFEPFAHNVSEVRSLLTQARDHLDSTSCGEAPFVPPNERLDQLYKDCVPHC
jgi:hypothetical protein